MRQEQNTSATKPFPPALPTSWMGRVRLYKSLDQELEGDLSPVNQPVSKNQVQKEKERDVSFRNAYKAIQLNCKMS